jgi:hypothetical protein
MSMRVFYYAYDTTEHSGGEIDTYNHVDILNECGFDAYALHTRPGYRHCWFENKTRVIDLASFWKIYDKESDFVVLPEPLGSQMRIFPGKKVIFNKNLYYGFAIFGRDHDAYGVYGDENVVAVIAVSEHNLSHLAFTFPRAKILRVFTRIDCGLFMYRPLAQKKKRIACVMKAEGPLRVLYNILWSRGQQDINKIIEYEWVFLRGYTLEQTAALLQDSLILIALNTFEGLPRIVLEAMSCGCLVIGYGAGPLKECLPPESQFEPDNFIGMAEKIESITNSFPAVDGSMTEWSRLGRKTAEKFTKERQKKCLLAAWGEILRT